MITHQFDNERSKKWDKLKSLVSGRSEITSAFIRSVNNAQIKENEWIKKLRAEGYKAAHPNDGWVDRVNNKICLAHPQFDDGVKEGDNIMLGWPNEKERPIKITGIQKGMLDYYLFEDLN